MDDRVVLPRPASLDAIERDTLAIGFAMASEPRTGCLLRALAASKPGGRLLELGTGTGIGAAWLLAGMDACASLISVDNDANVLDIARRHLGPDSRVTFHLGDGAALLAAVPRGTFDIVFADAWPGKFTHLDEALRLLRVGGIYVVDDLLPQTNWPDGHAARVAELIRGFDTRADFVTVRLAWASGVVMLVRTHPADRG